MKKILALILCVIAIINLTACLKKGYEVGSDETLQPSTSPESMNIDEYDDINTKSAVAAPVYPEGFEFEDYDSRLTIWDENLVEEGYINAINSFAGKIAPIVLKGKTENAMISPISLQMALALAGSGANGTTQEEILTVLGVEKQGTDYLAEQNANLFRLLYLDNKVGQLKIANSLWLQKDIIFHDEYLKNAADNFYASLYQVDFAEEDTAKLMSKWIWENTNKVLKPKLQLSPIQIMSIINTIYFKDEWTERFEEKDTAPSSFHLANGEETECDYMNQTFAVHGYLKGDGFTSSTLGLKNNGSMVFILPDKGVSTDDLLATPEIIFESMKQENEKAGKVIFQIPKFSFGSDFALSDSLNTLGIKDAFNSKADFSGITDGIAYISDIAQQTHIAIDEKGVEAAAFTQIMYCGAAMSNENIAEMILDRPFIFAITSNQGVILFMGVVNNPLNN